LDIDKHLLFVKYYFLVIFFDLYSIVFHYPLFYFIEFHKEEEQNKAADFDHSHHEARFLQAQNGKQEDPSEKPAQEEPLRKARPLDGDPPTISIQENSAFQTIQAQTKES
jgi:hypothetical protein